jgi:hypothetical protein
VEQLIELLQQIQDLAGAGIDALKGAKSGDQGAPPPEREPGGGGGGAPPEGGQPPALSLIQN